MLLQADNSNALSQAVRQLSANLMSYIAAISATGFLSMALIQSIKDFTPARRWFQRDWLHKWIAARYTLLMGSGFSLMRDELKIDGAMEGLFDLAAEEFSNEVEESIVRIATAGDSRAFYQMQLEQLCGQLNAVAQIALESPATHTKFVQVFGQLAGAEDLLRVLAGQPTPAGMEVNLEEQGKQGDSEEQGDAEDGGEQESEAERVKYGESLGRIAQAMQRSIDAIQIAAGAKWRLYLRWAAIGFSIVILSAATAFAGLSKTGNSDWQKWVLLVLAGSWISGFVAPVARDLIVALQNLRD